jgi:hypothetical protein
VLHLIYVVKSQYFHYQELKAFKYKMKHLGKLEGVASVSGVSNAIVIPTFMFGLQAWVHYAKIFNM